MLEKNKINNRNTIRFFCLEDLVPEDHILRKVDAAIDFSFIYDLVKDMYSENTGRPSIDPVVLFKIVFIQYMFGIRSMRQTIKEIDVNFAYRWFLNCEISDNIPHFSTFGKNYVRRFKGTDIFEKIFMQILDEAISNDFVDPSSIFIDGTHIKANANKNKYKNIEVIKEAKNYQKQLNSEIDKDRAIHNKKPIKKKDDDDESSLGTKNVKKSTTDPECGLFHKGEHEKCFAYTAQVACDRHNFILATEVSPGNIHDSVMFDKIYNKTINRFPDTNVVAIDSGYKTPWIMKQIIDDKRIPAIPYKRPMTKKGFFKKYEYVYDSYYDCIICPNNKILKYSTTNREGYQLFKSNPKECEQCPHLNQCTLSQNKQKVVTRHVWTEYMEKAEDYRHTPWVKEQYALRAQTIERVFGNGKEKHGMRYTKLRGLEKNKMYVLLISSCMNLLKLARWKARKGETDGTPKKGITKSSKLIENSYIILKITNLFQKKEVMLFV